MTKTPMRLAAVLLLISAINLTVMIPGGPIEVRSFATISPTILASFNAFLTILGMGSYTLAFFLFAGRRWALVPALLAGTGYLAVYVLDLGGIFPVSDDPMPRLLLILETAGAILSLPLIALTASLTRLPHTGAETKTDVHIDWRLMGGAAILAIAIVVFATYAAMGANP
jgi:hypothetical protein